MDSAMFKKLTVERLIKEKFILIILCLAHVKFTIGKNGNI